jgi:hypothetical protein
MDMLMTIMHLRDFEETSWRLCRTQDDNNGVTKENQGTST